MGARCTLFRPGLVPYLDARRFQEHLVTSVRAGGDWALILLEHPPVYTLGARARAEHLLFDASRFAALGAEVHETDRGGDVTFHGPGQLVGYPIIDLRSYGQGPVWYVRSLEQALIDALASFGIVAGRSEGRPGVWVGEEKIASIGVRVSRGVTKHGFALNVNTDLAYFDHIVPCGLPGVRVTSMERLTGERFEMTAVTEEVASALARTFELDLVEQEAAAGVAGGS